MTKFRLKDGTDKRRGRPEDVQMVKSFERVCIRLEETSDYKMYTIQEIHLKMAELNNPDNVYTTKRLKQKLKERYKDHLCFIMLPGRTDVVRFKDMASYILYQLKKKPRTKEEILQAAAHLIKVDIRELQQSKNMYSSVNDINDDGVTSRWVPESLNTFFQCLIPSETKRKGICQCVTQASQDTQIYYMLYSIWIRC